MSAFAVSAETSSALTSDANLTELTPTAAAEVMSFATDFASSYATSVATTLGLDNTTVMVTHSTKAEKMQFESMKNRFRSVPLPIIGLISGNI